jgi:hypothetical protein
MLHNLPGTLLEWWVYSFVGQSVGQRDAMWPRNQSSSKVESLGFIYFRWPHSLFVHVHVH